LRLPCLCEAYYILVMRYYHDTGGGIIRFQIQRSTGGFVATAS